METLDTYLQARYLPAPQFAAACGVSPRSLAGLLEDGLVPRPAYVVTGNGVLVSAAFGEMPAEAATPGEYHHPRHAAWVALALRLRETAVADEARAGIEQRFRSRFASALSVLDRNLHRLADSFDDAGHPIREGLDQRSGTAWTHFINGVYGVCVADPSNEAAIARKEILQEALGGIVANGALAHFIRDAAPRARQLVEQYSAATMPFSPPEYPHSSRRRLVDDLRAQLAMPAPRTRHERRRMG